MDVFEHADRLGLKVRYNNLGPRHGEITAGGTVYLNDLDPLELQVVALAHECGHYHYGHSSARTVDQLRRQERQADTYAARLLISPLQYASAERLYGHDVYLLAKELSVTPRIVEAWRTAHRYLSLHHARATILQAI